MNILTTILSRSPKQLTMLLQPHRHILLVTDFNVFSSLPSLQSLITQLQEQEIQLTLLSDLLMEPTDKDVSKAVAQRPKKIDCAFGIGGGSP